MWPFKTAFLFCKQQWKTIRGMWGDVIWAKTLWSGPKRWLRHMIKHILWLSSPVLFPKLCFPCVVIITSVLCEICLLVYGLPTRVPNSISKSCWLHLPLSQSCAIESSNTTASITLTIAEKVPYFFNSLQPRNSFHFSKRFTQKLQTQVKPI